MINTFLTGLVRGCAISSDSARVAQNSIQDLKLCALRIFAGAHVLSARVFSYAVCESGTVLIASKRLGSGLFVVFFSFWRVAVQAFSFAYALYCLCLH